MSNQTSQPIQLEMLKAGMEPPAPIQLPLSKLGQFITVELEWECERDHDAGVHDEEHRHDVDAHANTLAGGKLFGGQKYMLTTHNTRLHNAMGLLDVAADKSFQLEGGFMWHSGDAMEQHAEHHGEHEVDDDDHDEHEEGRGAKEFIRVFLGRIPTGVEEIMISATVYEHDGKQRYAHSGHAVFEHIEVCRMRVKDASGAVVVEYVLSKQFAEMTGVQFANLMVVGDNLEIHPIGRGFMGDYNYILRQIQ